jgi:Tfp pilus assembly protein PilO
MSLFLQQLLDLARRSPLAVISIILILLVGTGDYFFLLKRRNDLAERYDRTRQDGETMLMSLNGQPRITAQTATIEEALTYINKNLAVESDLAGNLDYFYQIEKSTKVHLISLSQLSSQPTTEDEAYHSIPFSLRLSGAYPQVLDYLHQLETGPRLLRVKNYRFSQTDSANAEGLALDLTVELLGRP